MSSNSSPSATATRPVELVKALPFGPPLAHRQKARSTKLQPRQSGTPLSALGAGSKAGLSTATVTPLGPSWVKVNSPQ